ncbi:MAG: serine/threonine-protein kinase [Kofleriaceae bacterium]
MTEDPTAVERPRAATSEAPSTDPEPTRPSFGSNLADHAQLATVNPENYSLGPELARGGMGRIHAARDRRLGREVAIKELLVDNDDLARRFEREARITARLQHPSIVSVHEAGRWPNGKPFYAMKLVSGRSLWDAIQLTNQPLSLLPNLLAVADAMAYAHAQRVIHRDLKPNNIILGEFGETVVIDWGIAKSLDDTDQPSTPIAQGGGLEPQTQVGAVLGTPGYMPPEQARGETVDERADVFAIGVMLFHTLARKMPWSGKDAYEKSLGGPPKLPASVPPDLAAICERALQPDLDKRYRSARELADDLRRFQTGQLVGAHRYSTRQLLGRWFARHKTAVIVGSIALAVLMVLGSFSLMSVFKARRLADEQRDRATQRSADAEDAMGFMLYDVAEKLRQAGRLELMDTVVRRAVTYYSTITDRDIDPTRLVTALMSIGDVLRAEGDLTAAAQEYERAHQIAAAHQLDGNVWRHQLALAENALGEVHYYQGDLRAAITSHRTALMIATALVAVDPDDARWQKDLATSLRLAATVMEDQGDIAGALEYLKTSFEIRKRLAAQHRDQATLRDLMVGYTDLGLVLARKRDIPAALGMLDAARDLAIKEADADPAGTAWQRDVAMAHERIGETLLLKGDTDDALAEYEQNLDVMKKLGASDSANADWQRRLATAYDRVGSTLLDLGRADEALPALETSRAMKRDLAKRDPTNLRWQRDLSHAAIRIGDARLAKGDPKGALIEYREARTLRETLVSKDTSSVKWLGDVFSARRRIGNALLATGDKSGGRDELLAAETLATEVMARDHSAIDDADLLDLHRKLAELYHGQPKGDDERAAALAIARKRAEREPTDEKRAQLVRELEAR